MRVTAALLASAMVLWLRPAAAQRDDGIRRFEPSPVIHVVVFVTRDCPVSNGYAPAIQRICRDYGPRGVRCTLVYEDRPITAAAVREHVGDYGYSGVATIVGHDGRVATQVGATVTPEAVVIDNTGSIRYRGRIDNRYAAPTTTSSSAPG